MVIQQPLRTTQLHIRLNTIADNLRQIRSFVGKDTAIMAVVKANGYGHGLLGIAPTLIENGAAYLAVATLSEALQLREAYPTYPIFILGHTPDNLLPYVVEHKITQTVFSFSQAQRLNELAKEQNRHAVVHIKVDTGFHRLGQCPSSEYAEEIRRIFTLKNVLAEGIFSHLALVNDEENNRQFRRFSQFVETLSACGCTFRYQHIADSIALVDYPAFHLNMVRPGALLYGMRGFHKGFLPVQPAMTFQTAVSQIHHIPAGEGLGYDHLWRAKTDSMVATLPFGYADGYPRNLRDKGYVLINDHCCPIIGVICMDQCMVDVTGIPNVACGTPAIIYGDGTNEAMTVATAAEYAGTNKNEILSRLSLRPERIYI